MPCQLELVRLIKLREFDLNDNQLEELPDSIGELSSIERLPLRNNRLKALPESVGKLNTLTTLDLRYNELFYLHSPTTNQRRLLAVIRSHFERIHRDISNLQPEQMVPIPDFPNVAISYEKLLAMERHQIKSFPEFVHNEVVTLDVRDLLNGVDLEGTRSVLAIEGQQNAANLFISYSHKDDHLRKELESHFENHAATRSTKQLVG